MRTIATEAIVIAALATAAVAQPTVAVRSTARCPSGDEVAAALPATVRVLDSDQAATMTITVEPDDDGATVTLAAGTRAERTHVAGRGCAALAGAIAALADVWLIELTAPPAPVIDDEPAPAPAPVVAPPATVAPRRDPPRWHLGLGRAVVLEDGAELGATTRIDATWRTPWRDAMVRGAFDWGDRAALTTTMATTTRRPWAGWASIGWRFDLGRVWTSAAGGAGLVVSHVETAELGATSVLGATVRLHPAATAIVDAGVVVGAGVSVRFELAAVAYPLSDQYTIAGAAAGHSPTRGLSAGLGLDIALGTK